MLNYKVPGLLTLSTKESGKLTLKVTSLLKFSKLYPICYIIEEKLKKINQGTRVDEKGNNFVVSTIISNKY